MTSEWVRAPPPTKRTPSRRSPFVVLGPVDAILVAVAHPGGPLPVGTVAEAEAGLDLAAEAAQGGGRDHALGRPADAHDRVHAGALDRARDRRREIAVGDELDPGAGRPELGDQRAVAGPVEDDDRDVAYPPAESLGDAVDVLGRR
jgi:hypothetical protein